MAFAIFPIGGKGERFEKAGYREPKPLIKIFGRSQLEWSILSCIHNYPDFQIVIGCREELLPEIKELTDVLSKRLNIEVIVLNVGKATLGAAHTIKIALELLEQNSKEFKFLVLDNDVAINMPNKSRFENGEAGLVITNSANPAHSFVIIDDNQNVRQIAEKEVISVQGVVGNYFFKSRKSYLDAYKRIANSNAEQYISEIIKVLLDAGKNICAESALTVVSYGTPEEIDRLSTESLKFLDNLI